MHILYIYQYFAIPNGTMDARSSESARRWAAKGPQATMLTTTAQLTDANLNGACGRYLKRVTIE
jgi:hypothetical protein